jgi:hypothetical protein
MTGNAGSLLAPPSGDSPPSLHEDGIFRGSSILLDDSLWPLLQISPGHPLTDSQVEDYLAARTRYLARNEPHLPLLDTRALHLPSAHQRQLYVDWLRAHGPRLHALTLGSACIIVSPAVKMMMSLIRHFASLSFPYVITPSPAEAASWAAQRLLEAGFPRASTRLRLHFGLDMNPPASPPSPRPTYL